LAETGFEGVEHPGQLEGAQRRLELVAAGHRGLCGGIGTETGGCSGL
jgi:hypothetical protein